MKLWPARASARQDPTAFCTRCYHQLTKDVNRYQRPPIRSRSIASSSTPTASSSKPLKTQATERLSRSMIFDDDFDPPLTGQTLRSKRHLPSYRRRRQYRDALAAKATISKKTTDEQVSVSTEHDPWARMVTSPMRQCIVTRQLLPSDFLIRLRPTYFPPDPQPQPRNSSPADLANASLKDDNQAIHPKPKPQSKPKSKSKSTNDPSMGGFYLTPCLSHSADTQTQTQSQSQTQPHTTPSRSYYITAHPSILARIHSAGPHLSLLKRFPDGALRIPADLDGWVRAELFERVLEELRLRRARAGSERGSRSGSGELMTVTVTVTMLEPAGPSSPDVTTWSQSLPPESQSIIVQVPPPTPPESDVVADPTSPLSNPPSSTSAAPIPRVILNPPPDLRNQLLAEIAGILAQEQPDQSSAVSPSLSSLSVDSAAGVTLAMTSRPGTKSMVPLMVALLRVRLMSGEGWEQIAR